jgi:hypothetical protein
MTAPQSEPVMPCGKTAIVTSRSLIRISQPNQCAMDGTVTVNGLSRIQPSDQIVKSHTVQGPPALWG